MQCVFCRHYSFSGFAMVYDARCPTLVWWMFLAIVTLYLLTFADVLFWGVGWLGIELLYSQ